MAKIILVRGMHPNEKSAKFFTPKIAAKLRELGHEVIPADIPIEDTIQPALKRATVEKPQVDETFAFAAQLLKLLEEHPDAIMIDVHNTQYLPDRSGPDRPVRLKLHDPSKIKHNESPVPPGKDPYYMVNKPNEDLPMHYTIEIPAKYPHDPAMHQKTIELLDALGEPGKRNWKHANGLGYLDQVGLRQTQAAGLLGEEMAEVIARGIHEQIIPNHKARK